MCLTLDLMIQEIVLATLLRIMVDVYPGGGEKKSKRGAVLSSQVLGYSSSYVQDSWVKCFFLGQTDNQTKLDKLNKSDQESKFQPKNINVYSFGFRYLQL